MKTKPYTVILRYLHSDASDFETFIEWADVDEAFGDHAARFEAVRQVLEQCAAANEWTLEHCADMMCDAEEAIVFQGHLTEE
jgi:hypothetical protein